MAGSEQSHWALLSPASRAATPATAAAAAAAAAAAPPCDCSISNAAQGAALSDVAWCCFLFVDLSGSGAKVEVVALADDDSPSSAPNVDDVVVVVPPPPPLAVAAAEALLAMSAANPVESSESLPNEETERNSIKQERSKGQEKAKRLTGLIVSH